MTLRQEVESRRKRLRITTHAQVEAFKDGLTLAGLRGVFEKGTIIEEYASRDRVLLLGEELQAGLPVHIVIEETAHEVVVTTAYVPDERLWIGGRRRRPQE